jgi:homoserine O-acetyltransferase
MPAGLTCAARERTIAIGSLPLDGGSVLTGVEQHIVTLSSGESHRLKKTALVCHALTGSSRVDHWWPAIAGDGALFDPAEWSVYCINALGSCYGSTGPSTYEGFPRVTVADIVRAQRRALDALEIDRIDAVIGGSLGGMQALQWALDEPQRVGHAIVVAAHDHMSALGIALNATQRHALALDPLQGLRLARKIAMLSYKSDDLLRERHDRRADRTGGNRFDVEGYLDHHADLLAARMDAATYETLTHAMDSFDVRAHGAAAGAFKPRLTFVGITSDWLFRAADVRRAAERFGTLGFDATYRELVSDHGHDAFLSEGQALADLLVPACSA